VLEGGALRGLFSAGVMDAMMEEGILFDAAVGVSAGAAFGSNYVSRQPGRAIRYNKRFAKDWRYCSLRSWLKTGDLFGAQFAYHELPTRLDIFDCQAFDDNPMAFYVVCTDVETGKAVYRKCDKAGHEFFDWVRASASMPLVSRVVPLDGKKLLDGGVADSIPLRFIESEGYHRNVVVLTQPSGYRKKHNPFMPLMRLSLRKYPLMVKALDQRHLMYNEQLDYVAQQAATGSIFVIQPDAPLPIGHISHKPEEMQRVYDIGREKAKSLMPQLKNFLQENKTL
jgi:predicted patatin/cPLA2 family phospholipase